MQLLVLYSRGNPTTKISHALSGGTKADADEETTAHTHMQKETKVQVRKAKVKEKAKVKAMGKDPGHHHRKERETKRFPRAQLRMESPTNLHAKRMRRDHVLEESCVRTGTHRLANSG